ncbi:MAG: beta-galactosidase [Candidatus Pacebacteria bacterium]|nr:beta-galactosidase [Candidatus Paceibacterota bacterium]
MPQSLASLLLITGLISSTLYARYDHWAEFTVPRHDGAYYNDIRPERLVTEHWAFAKPLAGGPVKTLMIVPAVNGRDVVELYQRLAVDFEAVTTRNATSLGWTHPIHTAVVGLTIPEKERELNRKLAKDYDVICLANVSFDDLPAAARFRILQQVKHGAGLLGLFGNNRPGNKAIMTPLDPMVRGSEIWRDTALAGFPFFKVGEKGNRQEVADRYCQTGRFGKGRVIWLNYHGVHSQAFYYGGDVFGCPAMPTPASVHVTSEAYDAALMLTARALLWAARREPPLVSSIDLEDGAVITRAEWPETLDGRLRRRTEFTGTVTVEACMVRPNGSWKAESRATVDVTADETTFKLTFSAPPQGPVFVLWRVRRADGAIVDFGATSLMVTGPRGLTAAFAEECVSPGASLALNVTLEAAAENCRLVLAAHDVFERVYWRDERQAAATQVISIPTDTARGRWGSVRIDLVRDEELLDRRDVEFFMPREFGYEFVRLLWGHCGVGSRGNANAAGSYRHYLMGQQQRRFGWNTGMTFGNERLAAGVRSLARANAATFDYCTHVKGGHFYGFFKPETQKSNLASLEARGNAGAPFKPLAYNLGDENDFAVREEMTTHQLAWYRTWLRERYDDDLAELNRYWKSDYQSFDVVNPTLPEGATMTRRIDLRSFWDWAYAEVHHQKADALRAGDPDAKCGAEGSKAGDLELTISKLDWWAPYYNRYVNSMLRFWMPDSLRANWWGGYTVSGRPGPQVLWRQLATGSVNSSFWFIGRIGPEGASSTDISFPEYLIPWQEPLKQIEENVGPLLKAAAPVNDGVGIYHSRLSQHVNDLDSRFASHVAAQRALLSTMDGLGLNARFVTDRHILAGKLDPAVTRVLLVACPKAVPDDLPHRLEDYVRNGGVLIADVGLDYRDGRGATVTPGRLLSLFGAQSTSPEPAQDVINYDAVEVSGHQLSLTTSEPCMLDASIRATDNGDPLAMAGEVPILIHRSLGKGQLLLLNFDLYHALGLARDNGTATTDAAGDFLLQLLALGNVHPALPPMAGLPWKSVRTFQLADALLVGLYNWDLPGSQRTFRAGAGWTLHALDPVLGPDRARVISIPDKIHATVLTALPPGKRSVRLKGPSRATPGGQLEFEGLCRKNGNALPGSLLRFEVQGPDGSTLDAHRQFSLSGNDPVAFSWPVALNAAPGSYRVRLVELLSGETADTTVNVEVVR